MEVNFNTANFQNLNNSKSNKSPHIYPSFKMKMNELKGIDQFVARKYKINPMPIKTLQDFQKTCKDLVDNILNRANKGEFKGRQQETQIQRKAMIKDWHDYVTKENGVYTGAMALMILGGITAGLKPKEDTLPPVLNKGVLADTVEEINSTIPENPDDNVVSFDKKYRLNLQKSMMCEEKALDESLNGWIVIPSKEHDPENFEANVDKLKMLSHDNWCTKSFNAKPYLSEGDFHVYMENGKPALGVRFVGDEIEEIQGELNNSKIPVKYDDIVKIHIKDFKLTDNAKQELENLETVKAEIKRIKSKFPKGIENATTQEILESLGIMCKKDYDGLLVISHYGDSEQNYSYSDLGINENKLFNDIKVIEKDADFSKSLITNLGNLQLIGGFVDFSNSKITNIGNLQKINGNAYFSNSQITNLANLQSIGGHADFRCSQVVKLGNLKSIGGYAHFENSKITNLGNLQSIGGDAYFNDSKITNLGSLKLIGGNANFNNSQITDLSNLQTIGGNVYLHWSSITNLGNLQSIGGDVWYINSSKLKPNDFDLVKVCGKINS